MFVVQIIITVLLFVGVFVRVCFLLKVTLRGFGSWCAQFAANTG